MKHDARMTEIGRAIHNIVLHNGVHAYLKDSGRVWVEAIEPNSAEASVRYDSGEGTRGRLLTVPLAWVDFTREWKI